MSLCRGLGLAFLFLCGSFMLPSARAQSASASVRGTVADPDNAVIPGATITLTPAVGKPLTTLSGSDGSYKISAVASGTYSITITMVGFASFVRQNVRLSPNQILSLDAKLAIQEQDQVVQVTTQSNLLSVDQDSNASSTVIRGKDLDALSDDPDELSSELSALAGPSAGPNGGQVYIDGFTGGQLPPKSSIREIRVNQNPFSSQFDRLGYGRVEVFTKPGTDKFHGSVQINGNDSSFNTGNPLLNSGSGSQIAQPIAQPPYHTIFNFGNLTGPINKFASFTVGESYRSIQDNSIVNGTILAPSVGSTTICQPGDTTCVVSPYQAAISTPQTRWEISPRLDLAIGSKNTLTARYQYERNSQQNGGVGTFVTQSAGNNSTSSESEIQISDTQVVSAHVINETRFEYQHSPSSQTALSAAPNIAVQGNFTTGGSGSGTSSDVQDHIEVQNYTSIALQKNFIRAGGRLRLTKESNTTTAGTNGLFTYSSLAAYQANTPSQFSITKVNSGITATTVDLGVYAEDDWKVRPNLTLSYGVRYEVQNYIAEHHDFAPRLSFAWGIGADGKGTPKIVLRGGFGLFYDRFQLSNQVTTVQLNGVNQIRSTAVFTNSPALLCSPSTIGNCLSSVASSGNTTYTASPNLRTPYTMQFALGFDRQLFKGATLSVNYLNARGVHQYNSENINSPVNGFYPVSGQPLGSGPVLDQFQSEGVYRQNQLIMNVNIRTSKYFSLFGYDAIGFAKSDTSGAGSFPSVPFNLGADYGRASFDTRNRLFLGGSINAKYHVTLSPFLLAFSGTPYNITTGTDVNGDSVFNDRPRFANGNSGQCTVRADFVVPASGTTNTTPIPINYCTGPALFSGNLRVTKTFGFGAETGTPAGQNSGGPGPGGPGGRGPGGRGGPGGPGGFGGASTGRRYNLNAGAQFQNLFNYAALSTPIGNLASQQFGRSTQLAGFPFTSNSAVQRIQIFVGFTF